jgi:isoaspartyl peptidase/L-asparaginase-like protein (Ntn-hydrolase superfamily)
MQPTMDALRTGASSCTSAGGDAIMTIVSQRIANRRTAQKKER